MKEKLKNWAKIEVNSKLTNDIKQKNTLIFKVFFDINF